MTSAMYPDNDQPPPPYEFGNQVNIKTASPSPPPFYIQSTLNPSVGVPFLGRNPTPIQCPRCQRQVVTGVQYEAGAGTWLISLAICFFGGIFGCCFIPFCVPDCQDALHSCPACKNIIGRRNLL